MKQMFVVTILLTISLSAQQPAKQDSTLFDFWVGTWDLTWKDPDGTVAKGKNVVTKILDGKAIQENFSGLTGQAKGMKGQSISILDNRTGEWKQTWVDNQSSYLPFTGGLEKDGSRFFAQEYVGKRGMMIKQKMVFHDITKNTLVWDWMNSLDSGKTWNVMWTINYKRKS